MQCNVKSHNETHCIVLYCAVLYCIVCLHLCTYVLMCLCMCSGTFRFGFMVSSDKLSGVPTYIPATVKPMAKDDDGSARDLLAHGVMEFALSREVTATAAHEARLCNRIMGSWQEGNWSPRCLVLSVGFVSLVLGFGMWVHPLWLLSFWVKIIHYNLYSSLF